MTVDSNPLASLSFHDRSCQAPPAWCTDILYNCEQIKPFFHVRSQPPEKQETLLFVKPFLEGYFVYCSSYAIGLLGGCSVNVQRLSALKVLAIQSTTQIYCLKSNRKLRKLFSSSFQGRNHKPHLGIIHSCFYFFVFSSSRYFNALLVPLARRASFEWGLHLRTVKSSPTFALYLVSYVSGVSQTNTFQQNPEASLFCSW